MDETSDSDYRLLNNTNNSLSYGWSLFACSKLWCIDITDRLLQQYSHDVWLCITAQTSTRIRGRRTSVRRSTACTCAWLCWRSYLAPSVDALQILCSLLHTSHFAVSDHQQCFTARSSVCGIAGVFFVTEIIEDASNSLPVVEIIP